MVVKPHELVVHDDQLMQFAGYIEHINEDPNYLPSISELTQITQDIINCLAHIQENDEQMWTLLNSVEEYILRILNAVNDNVRREIVTVILNKFYSVISNPETEAGPATSVLLVVLAGSGEEAMLSAARWLIQQNENGPANAGLKAALSCLYTWVCEWRHTLTLGDWVMSFIKALEENEKYDILLEVSLDHIVLLFLAIKDCDASRQNVADVIFHVMASLRTSPEALDRISPHINIMLTDLAEESGQWSRHLLQTLVDILTTMMDTIYLSQKSELEKEDYKSKYSDAINCMEQHMPSRARGKIKISPWNSRNNAPSAVNSQVSVIMKKIGLDNLGNTCYINSVIQALLLTKQFSIHVMLRMTEAPYWSRMAILFAKMVHSISPKLNPEDFYSVVKPPFFTKNKQHDSSEFLGYLFMLLQSYEFLCDKNFDYSQPPSITNAARSSSIVLINRPNYVTQEGLPSASHAQSDTLGPKPGSSAGGSNANSRKRHIPENEDATSKKRMRSSFVDNMFGGLLRTCIQCTVCRSSSISIDVFRDLQLAFPEKLDGPQHTVQSLLEYYCSKESMSGENKYHCTVCGGLRDAEKTVIVDKPPKYLILVLKNFKFEVKTRLQKKLMLSTHHNDSITLPVTRTVKEPHDYTLYAAVIHDGTTLDSGHYYTLAKDNAQWFIFNDEFVSVADDNHLNTLNRSSTPYILFYRRNDVEEGPIPSLEELPPLLQESVMAHNKSVQNNAKNKRPVRRSRQ